MNKVFVLGSLNMDFIISVDRMPKLGETVQGNGFQSSPGGKGANQAVALAKQHIETYMIGSVGDDMIGTEIKNSLNEYNVKCDFLETISSQSSGVACIVLEDCDNRIMTDSGANAYHDISRIDHILETYADHQDVLLAQLEIPIDIINKSFNTAKSIGMRTILNAAPIKEIPSSIFANTDILIVNESEGEYLVGQSLEHLDIDQFMNQLMHLGVKQVILTLGAKGSYYLDDSIKYYIPAFKVSQVIDTTGAGDAYIGCFVSEMVKGTHIQKALIKASACGAITIQKKGVHHVIPSPEDIEVFLNLRSEQ